MKVVLNRIYDAGVVDRRRLVLQVGESKYNIPVAKHTSAGLTTVSVAGLPMLEWSEPIVSTRLLDSDDGFTFETRDSLHENAIDSKTYEMVKAITMSDNVISFALTLTDSWNKRAVRTYSLTKQLAASDFRFEISGQMLNLKAATGDTIITSYQLPSSSSQAADDQVIFVNHALVTAHLQSPGDQLNFNWPGYTEAHEVVADVAGKGGALPAVTGQRTQNVRLMSDVSGDNVRLVYRSADGELSHADFTAAELGVNGSAVSKLGWEDLGL